MNSLRDQPLSARLALVGLVVLAAWLLRDPPAPDGATGLQRVIIGALCAAPLVVLAFTGLRARRQWGGWVATIMVPYITLATGSLLVAPANLVGSVSFTVIAVLVFFAGIDAGRRLGAFRRN
jgi:uncharacterized membrane protein